MNINILSSSRFVSRLVVILVIVLIQLPAISPALDFTTSTRSDIDIFSIGSQANVTSPLTVFSNPAAIAIADRDNNTAGGTLGLATPYPSAISVAALPGTISDVNVTITGLSAARPRDINIVLVAPTGQALVLFGDAGDLNTTVPGINLTFDDSAAGFLPDLAPIPSGTYKPTDIFFSATDRDDFPAPGPAAPNNPAPEGAATLASTFNGIAPNGTWNLFITDDSLGGGASAITGGWSIDITTVGGIDPTTTTISSNINPALTGQSITFTSTTTNNTTAAAVTTGTVTFTNNGVNIPSCVGVAVSVSGQATCTTTLSEGTRSIVANYSGTGVLGASNGSLTQVVNSPTVVTGAQFCNNGGLTIIDGSSSAPIYPSNITVASLFGTVSTVTAQINGLTAPRTNNLDFLLVGPGGQAFQMMSDVGDATTPVAGINLTLADSAGGQLPVGTAITGGTFRPTDSAVPGSPDVYPAPAPAVFSLAAPAGAATFTNVYSTTNQNGTWRLYAVDDGVGGGNSTITGWCVNFTVAPFSTTTAVTSSANPSVFGQPVTFTATVSSAGGTPTGNVQFFDGATPIGAATALNGAGQVTLSTSALTVGSHAITAQYVGATVGAGGGGFAGSTGTLTGTPQVVNKANTTTTVVSSLNPSGTGVPVTFTATVSPVAPGAGTRTGSVTFFRGPGDPVCVGVVINGSGQATCNITFTISTTYNITVQYSGDGNFNVSTSGTLVQTALGPTAAGVNVSGRVLDENGRGVSGARVSLQNQNGDYFWAITNPFGYYRFLNVQVDETYLVTVGHKRHTFAPRTINLIDELTGLDFTPVAGSRTNGQKEQGPVNRSSP